MSSKHRHVVSILLHCQLQPEKRRSRIAVHLHKRTVELAAAQENQKRRRKKQRPAHAGRTTPTASGRTAFGRFKLPFLHDQDHRSNSVSNRATGTQGLKIRSQEKQHLLKTRLNESVSFLLAASLQRLAPGNLSSFLMLIVIDHRIRKPGF